MALDLGKIKTHMEMFEGAASHMFLDMAGRVSVGVSHVLLDVASAQALQFIDRETGELATPAQIASDFEAIRSQPKALLPYLYESATTLDLPEADVDVLFGRHIQACEEDLRVSYPNYDMFPDTAKLALLDMVFSPGTSGLQSRWPRLHTAINLGDWHAAALECTRPEAQSLRNENTKALFEIANSELRARGVG